MALPTGSTGKFFEQAVKAILKEDTLIGTGGATIEIGLPEYSSKALQAAILGVAGDNMAKTIDKKIIEGVPKFDGKITYSADVFKDLQYNAVRVHMWKEFGPQMDFVSGSGEWTTVDAGEDTPSALVFSVGEESTLMLTALRTAINQYLGEEYKEQHVLSLQSEIMWLREHVERLTQVIEKLGK